MARKTIAAVLRDQKVVLNGYISMPGAFSAELYSRQGWDAVTLDLQHGLISDGDAVAILQAISAIPVVPMARISWLEPAGIMRLLDAGVLGITCPMINTAEEARRLVSYCRYPPAGIRSMGPIRAELIDGPSYASGANDAINVFAMIETVEGLRNIEEIAAVEGLDGVYIGFHDLALSMGLKNSNPRDAAVESAIDAIVKTCAQHGLIVGGLAAHPEGAQALAARGFRFVTLSSDAQLLAQQTRNYVQAFRQAKEG